MPSPQVALHISHSPHSVTRQLLGATPVETYTVHIIGVENVSVGEELLSTPFCSETTFGLLLKYTVRDWLSFRQLGAKHAISLYR